MKRILISITLCLSPLATITAAPKARQVTATKKVSNLKRDEILGKIARLQANPTASNQKVVEDLQKLLKNPTQLRRSKRGYVMGSAYKATKTYGTGQPRAKVVRPARAATPEYDTEQEIRELEMAIHMSPISTPPATPVPSTAPSSDIEQEIRDLEMAIRTSPISTPPATPVPCTASSADDTFILPDLVDMEDDIMNPSMPTTFGAARSEHILERLYEAYRHQRI